MKIPGIIARYPLGLIFVFGLNGFLHFIPASPPAGVAGQFFGALYVSHYLPVIFLLLLIPGIFLLLNRFVPLALTLGFCRPVPVTGEFEFQNLDTA